MKDCGSSAYLARFGDDRSVPTAFYGESAVCLAFLGNFLCARGVMEERR